MHNLTPSLRRSSRVSAAVPILVTSLEPETHFSEVCETLVVSAHGCAIRSPRKLKAGAPLHFHSKDGRDTTAQVVSCQPIGSGDQEWKLAARLDQPDNFWGLTTFPKDWSAASFLPKNGSKTPVSIAAPKLGEANTGSTASQASRRIAEEQLQEMIAECVRPLQAELSAIKEKLSRADANRSRFEVSLSSIPPELEQQLEARLKNTLQPRVLDEARQQSASLLQGVKETIDRRTTEGYEDFLHRVADELQQVEQRAHEISGQVSEEMRDRLQAGNAEFQQKLIDAGNRLKGLSEELLEYLQTTLHDEHSTFRAELERVRDAVAEESSRLEQQVDYLDIRISKLDESACRLESGLDKRLGEMASETVRNTRAELESVTETICKEASNRNLEALAKQLDEACANMITFQKGTVASASDALRTKRTEALRHFERSMEELAAESVERWRQTLATGLNSLVKNLGEQFQLQAESVPNGKRS